MKPLRYFPALAVIALLIGLLPWPSTIWASAPQTELDRWQVMLIGAAEKPGTAPPAGGNWQEAHAGETLVELPPGAKGVWIRLQLPSTESWLRPGILASKTYGLNINIYRDGKLLYETTRDYQVEMTRLLLPVDSSNEENTLDVLILTNGERAGFLTPVQLGEFNDLEKSYMRSELPSLLLGVSIIFLALLMSVCSIFLSKHQRSFWISLCIIALTTGVLIASYSPLPYLYYPSGGRFFSALFELALFTMFPALGYFVSETFERKSPRFHRFTRWQAYYSLFGILLFLAYSLTGDKLYPIYSIVSVLAIGVLMLVQMVWISVLSISYWRRGDSQARVLAFGLLAFALPSATDLILYYANNKSYVLFLWKLGFVAFVLSLVIILARRISNDYKTLLSYSKQLELFNLSLERTEKLKIISDLAASVAHEVRNPLQVTRGFLQLLSKKDDQQNQGYITIAVNELDRAAEIITDFLTFAKPELESVSRLDIRELLEQLDLIMGPHASMHGGRLVVVSEEGMEVMGSASKLKQALINLIKNSVEAFGEEGLIELSARAEGSEAVLRIKDNGEGMDEEQLSKLGVPYFSTKSKGTGLGTMVTMRIIEVMNGSIIFQSQKGKGTEVTIRFPLVDQLASSTVKLPH
ncbi:HAMP domain-containing histidine kinase [Paenibacillus pasadenensis]|uniref:sensor histidine kinase n=1 Tax=Paenibacillus pasadenensis TaxID=217090 RepID=UPI00204238F7|nr:sensor histidine kinase [Paenibacillus pasadenensis]MCM3747907.1 HAMP domain-containing histidine kinase [Paenibacillus pasadenensis]